ncbi:MAG: DUF1778 domain-containing protein [Verrucomicrobiota bacterium]
MATLTAKHSVRPHLASTARLEARVPRDLKKTLAQAAAVTGHSTLTSFVIFVLQSSARKIIEEHKQAKLTAEESAHFVEALLKPAAPNAQLRAAFARYREVRANA